MTNFNINFSTQVKTPISSVSPINFEKFEVFGSKSYWTVIKKNWVWLSIEATVLIYSSAAAADFISDLF